MLLQIYLTKKCKLEWGKYCNNSLCAIVIALKFSWGRLKIGVFNEKLWCVQCIHCTLSATKTDAIAVGITTGVSIRLRHMCAGQPSSNYPPKDNFSIEITKFLAHRNIWAPARAFDWDWNNWKTELAGLELMEIYCIKVMMAMSRWGACEIHTVLAGREARSFFSSRM